MATIGQKLGEARRESGQSVEDVSHETHIHPNTIRSIEQDDFSQFASVAYARSFIRQYADFLEVDVTGAMEALNSGVTIRLGDNELMGEMKQTIRKDRRFRLERRPKAARRKLEKPGRAPILLNLILGSLIVGLAIFYFLGFDAGSPEEAKSEIARGLRKANPFSGEEDAASAVDPTATTPHPLLHAEVVAPPEEEESVEEATGLAMEKSREGAPPAPAREEVVKPDVEWSVDEAQPAPLARVGAGESVAPRARQTPGLTMENNLELPPIQDSDLPTTREDTEKPAELRPEGTDPAAEHRRVSEGERADPEGSGEENPKPSLRAVPVARAE